MREHVNRAHDVIGQFRRDGINANILSFRRRCHPRNVLEVDAKCTANGANTAVISVIDLATPTNVNESYQNFLTGFQRF